MVTDGGPDCGDSVDMCNPHSEYPLQTWKPLHPHTDLLCDTPALYAPGIGHIAQYDCYCDMVWEKRLPYFVRDCLSRTIERALDDGAPLATLWPDIDRLNRLNSKIRAYESGDADAAVE